MSSERLGRLVRETWMAWASEQPRAKPSWLLPWEQLDDGQREADTRIGEAVAANERERIRRLATGHLAVCTCKCGITALGDRRPGHPRQFADLLEPGAELAQP